MKYILSLTRCCTYNCEFCAVDAHYNDSVSGCAALAAKEREAGRELGPAQWCDIVAKILRSNPNAEFDLSGGDCLALPWVYQELIPFINEKTHNKRHVAITATAKSLVAWLNADIHHSRVGYPGAIHLTYDGYRPYSSENIALVPQVHRLGIEVHVECPLTVENCHVEGAHLIYNTLRDAGIPEVLLMSYFPVGRGGDSSQFGTMTPTKDNYRMTISEFMRLEKHYPDGPRVKVQCALKGLLPGSNGNVPCKMGDDTWCIMPDGTLLTCPWAYGLGGCPLDVAFVAGNALKDEVGEWRASGKESRNHLRRKYPRQCMIKAYAADVLDGSSKNNKSAA